MIDAVRKALSGDYAAQVKAYAEHGDNNFLKRVLSSGDTKINRERVRKELLSMLKAKEAVNSVIIKGNPAPEISKDEKEKAIYKEINRLFDQQRNLHGQMVSCLVQETRAQLRQEIISLDFQIRKKYDDLSYYKEFGFLPGSFSDLAVLTTVHEVYRKIKTTETLISKAKHGKKPKEKIPEWEAMVLELKRRLDHEFA